MTKRISPNTDTNPDASINPDTCTPKKQKTTPANAVVSPIEQKIYTVVIAENETPKLFENRVEYAAFLHNNIVPAFTVRNFKKKEEAETFIAENNAKPMTLPKVCFVFKI
jgi:hypothetical protein